MKNLNYKIYMTDNWEVTLVCYADTIPVFINDYTYADTGIHFKGCLPRDVALFFQGQHDMRKRFSRFYLESPETIRETLQDMLTKIETHPLCKCVGKGDSNGLVTCPDNMSYEGDKVFQKAVDGIDRLDQFM